MYKISTEVEKFPKIPKMHTEENISPGSQNFSQNNILSPGSPGIVIFYPLEEGVYILDTITKLYYTHEMTLLDFWFVIM